MKQSRWLIAVAFVLGTLLGGVLVASIGSGVHAQEDEATPESAAEYPAVEIVERVREAVVTVVNEQTVSGFGQLQPVGSGTGFIIDEEGHVVTNWHVVTGGQEFLVILANGDRRPATLVGSDPLSDLAVVRIEGEVPATVPLGDSDLAKPGQPVLAIGSPLGSFTNTVTQGIVSATGRDFPGASTYTDLIQHDAAINPGNSGGPLFNFNGEVIGVNTLGIPSQNGQPVQGLFFAIPSNLVREIAETLINEGRVIYPYFGIGFQTVTWNLAAQLELPVDNGVLVTDVVSNSPADDAGIQPGDIIVAIDGQPIDQENSFSEVLFEHEPGETVIATVNRDGDEIEVEVTLAERPDNI
ncbi:MAG TPA: trypsin-like peptidase domain-containing protein [Thermomicrobiales bacterium]